MESYIMSCEIKTIIQGAV